MREMTRNITLTDSEFELIMDALNCLAEARDYELKYARSCGNNWTSGGEGIKCVTEQEARAWMERHADADEYEAAFGPAEEA